mmetsp:Transcript_27940/g.80436  ORF Transcript_27940/g.80436 Transcript_27940/m.80436 type:complete len:87 (+) Transcript_27940:277-537(+)
MCVRVRVCVAGRSTDGRPMDGWKEQRKAATPKEDCPMADIQGSCGKTDRQQEMNGWVNEWMGEWDGWMDESTRSVHMHTCLHSVER